MITTNPDELPLYSIVLCEQVTEDEIPCTTYGISYRRKEALINDISSDMFLVSKMAELFNLCELPPERLKRVVIDLIP